MKTKILYVWEVLRTSFWFIPLIIVLIAIMASFGFVYLDSNITYKPSGFFLYFFSGGVDAARNILSTIAGAMLGVASTVFSITLVALTLASSQFGSRLLRNFMHDRLNQTVLGAYVATFIYCLLILRTVKSDNGIEFIPSFSILFAIVVAVGNIFLLIVFIHHISVSIQADQVITDIGINLDKNIKTLFPEELGEEDKEIKETEEEKKAGVLKEKLPIHDAILCADNGYLQAIDNEGLMSIASENDLLFTLPHNPGDYLVKNMELLETNSRKELDDNIKNKIRDAFILGNKRTPIQDAEFAIHQMVEIAARALSPGVNDPYTAITCIDKLTSSICHLTGVKFPSAYRYDTDNKLRVIAKPLTFSGMLDASFNQIRQFGKNSPAVLIRLMESLIIIKKIARMKSHKEAAERHGRMVFDAAKSISQDANDFNDLEERYEKLQKK